VAALGPGRSWTEPAAAPEFQETMLNAPDPFTSTTAREGLLPAYGVDLAVRLLPWLRLGASWQRYDAAEPDPGPYAFRREVARTTPGPRAYAEAVLPTPRRNGFGLDLALGGGIEHNEVALTRDAMAGWRTLQYRYGEATLNPFLQGTAELVLPGRTSLFARYTRRSLPTIAAESIRIETGTSDPRPLYTMEAHEVGFGYQELVLGTRFRY
jgi:hypothetical protein